MKFFLLTGGLGTRAEPLASHLPKPLFPLAGKPLLERMLEQLHAGGLQAGWLNLHHLPHHFTPLLRDWPGVLTITEERLSGCRVLREAPLEAGEPLLVLNGDMYMEVPLAAMAERMRACAADAVLAVRPRPDDGYNALFLDGDRFLDVDKSRRQPMMFTGAALFGPRALAAVNEANFFDSWRGAGLRVHTVCAAGPWLDFGDPARYLAANISFIRHYDLPPAQLLAGARVQVGAEVHDSVLWPGVEVPSGVTLRECIAVGPVRIAPGRYRRRILTPAGEFPLDEG